MQKDWVRPRPILEGDIFKCFSYTFVIDSPDNPLEIFGECPVLSHYNTLHTHYTQPLTPGSQVLSIIVINLVSDRVPDINCMQPDSGKSRIRFCNHNSDIVQTLDRGNSFSQSLHLTRSDTFCQSCFRMCIFAHRKF